jgi:hypothetical protein
MGRMDRRMNNSILQLNRIEAFATDNVSVNNQGVLGTAIAGHVTNIDLKMLDDNFIIGGILHTLNTKFGDHVILQVIDIDNILGFGPNTVLGQYCTTWYLRDDQQEQLDENNPYPSKIAAGLYLRLIYTSTGETDVTVIINYRLHKALY